MKYIFKPNSKRIPTWVRLGIALLATAGVTMLGPVRGAAQPQRDAALRVIVDKAEVINVAGTPSVVLIANPQIADVIVEHNRLVFVVGKSPGETRLYVYDNAGRRLLEREVVVVPEDDRAVTVVRDTLPTNYSCNPRCVSLIPKAIGSYVPTGTETMKPASDAPSTGQATAERK